MKKHKILFAVISALMAVGMIFAAACGGGYSETQNDDKFALLDLVVDYGAAKYTYNLGEELDTTMLFCSAKLINVATDEVTVDEDIADDIQIDGSEFDSSVVGSYNIYISYTHAGVTRTKSYPVEVIGKDAVFGGIEVEYPAGTVNRVTLQPGTTQTTISVSDLIVKQVDTNGNVTGTLPASDYDIELYKGTVKQDSWTVGGGAYTIRATLKSNPKISNFVSYYVIDDLKSITFDVANSVTTQSKGDDVISSTWKFTITYNSGATKVVTGDDDRITITGFNPNVVGNPFVSIKYTEKSALGAEMTASCSFRYTITG